MRFRHLGRQARVFAYFEAMPKGMPGFPVIFSPVHTKKGAALRFLKKVQCSPLFNVAGCY